MMMMMMIMTTFITTVKMKRIKGESSPYNVDKDCKRWSWNDVLMMMTILDDGEEDCNDDNDDDDDWWWQQPQLFWKRRKQLINWRDRKLTCRKCLISSPFIEILAIVVFRSHANDVRRIGFQVLNLVAELALSFWRLYVLSKDILRCKSPVLHNVAINSKGYSFFRRQPLNTKLVWFLIRDCYV